METIYWPITNKDKLKSELKELRLKQEIELKERRKKECERKKEENEKN